MAVTVRDRPLTEALASPLPTLHSALVAQDKSFFLKESYNTYCWCFFKSNKVQHHILGRLSRLLPKKRVDRLRPDFDFFRTSSPLDQADLHSLILVVDIKVLSMILKKLMSW